MKSLKVVEHKRFENDTFLEAVTCSSVSEKKEFYIVPYLLQLLRDKYAER